MRLRTAVSAMAGLTMAVGLAAVPALGAAPAGSALSATSSGSTVLLPTGERVQLATDRTGHRSLQVIPTARPAGAASVSTMRIGSDSYVIPAIARPYLGTSLDPALFDVTSRAGQSRRVPVHLAYTGATPTVPGITITSASGGNASGYLTAASANSFGTALMRQYTADAKAGWPKRTTLISTVTRLSAASSAPIAAPTFPMKTLIIKVSDIAGKPVDFAFAALLNVDDGRKYGNFLQVVDGEARVSVPTGHYAGVVEVDELDPVTFLGSIRMVPFDSYSVTDNGQTLSLNAASATAKLAVRTPRPAATVAENWEWDRTDALGYSSFSVGTGAGPGVDIYVAPTPAPPASQGALHSLASWSLAGTPSTGLPYTYDLAYPAAGVPAAQSHVVASSQLETISAGYYSDSGTTPGEFLRYPILPFQFLSGGSLNRISLPTQRTEYVQPVPDAIWTAVLLPNDYLDDPFSLSWSDGYRVFTAGTTTRQDWLKGPLVPGIPVNTTNVGASYPYCYACRSDDELKLFFAPSVDTTPGHTGSIPTNPDGTPVARLHIYENGNQVVGVNDEVGAQFAVPSTAASYRVVLDVDRSLVATQSSAVHTELGFTSAAATDAKAPSGWGCGLAPPCRVPGVLQASVDLPTDLTGVVPIGTSTVGVTLNHIQGAAATAIASTKVEVRVSGGSWQTLTAVGGHQFRLTTTAAEAGRPVDLRVTGSDTAGGYLTQTTTTAFLIASS